MNRIAILTVFSATVVARFGRWRQSIRTVILTNHAVILTEVRIQSHDGRRA
ncbi:hypothetical protein [Sphingomonas faeni]|uniref:hypothetical protein n=1 Tax=Sphingomonas faeni TaxID=185950 RepID=UPI00335ECF44